MQIGFIGLGKMGTRMVEKLLREEHSVIGWNRSKDMLSQFTLHLTEQKLIDQFTGVHEVSELVNSLSSPKIVWMMLPAGDATQNMFDELLIHLEKGDILIDGGNAFFKDTQKRFEKAKEKGIRYLGIGVSGGIKAAENGYPFMVGGDKSAYEAIMPVLESLSKPNGGFEYFGTGGAGHFVKMVHNGIEYGMMQALGEGYGVLEQSPYELDLLKVATLWQKGTIVTSFLNDCALGALQNNPGLKDIDGVIDATGEADWTVTTGKEQGVPVENIEQSLNFRRKSTTEEVRNSFAARMVAALRGEFGGHAVKKRS